jgi:hypothetical protein
MAYDGMIANEAGSMGRPPKEPTEVLGLRLPVSQIEALDKALANKSQRWPEIGIDNRSDLIRYAIAKFLEKPTRR